MSVVLLEFIDEFESFIAYIKNHDLNIQDFEIIALEYELQTYLTKKNISYTNSLPYFGKESHKEILLKFNDIFNHIERNFNFIDGNGVKNVYLREYQHYIEILVNYILKIIEILENISKKKSDIILYACEKIHINASLQIREDRFLGWIVRQFAHDKNIDFYGFGDNQKKFKHNLEVQPKKQILYRLVFKILKYYFKIFNKKIILLPTKGYGFQKFINQIKTRHRDVVFITIYDDSNTKWLRKAIEILYGILFRRFRINIDFIHSFIDPNKKNKLQNEIDRALDDPDIFKFHDVKFGDILKSKINVSLSKYLHKMLICSSKIRSFLGEVNSIKLIMSPYGRGIWYLLPEISKYLGIPSLFISHGTHPAPTNKYHEIAIFNLCIGCMLGDYSHIAISTPVQEKHLHYFKSKYNWIKNEEIKTGPLIFSEVTENKRLEMRSKFNLKESDFVIVHATSIKWKGTERFYFIETIDEYISALTDIVNFINKYSHLKLIIRLHPGFDYISKNIHLFLPESDKFVISETGSFSDVLSASDLLISYSSSCIDEALINKIPVVLYNKWDTYNHFNTEVFKNDNKLKDYLPVCYVNNKDNLESALKFVMDNYGKIKKGDVCFDRYRYNEDYISNFYNFIKESLSLK